MLVVTVCEQTFWLFVHGGQQTTMNNPDSAACAGAVALCSHLRVDPVMGWQLPQDGGHYIQPHTASILHQVRPIPG